jgi:hypothetical protein
MDYEFEFKPSAFRHGYTEADIRHAFKTAIYDGDIDGFENKYLLVGFDTKILPIEVMYNEFGENGRNVFHVNEIQEKNANELNIRRKR